MTISFSRHQFPPAVIRHAVWRFGRQYQINFNAHADPVPLGDE
jgi:hypothetical protein